MTTLTVTLAKIASSNLHTAQEQAQPVRRRPVTGGAFRRFDSNTAELKRIWTDSRDRRQGHAKALLAALEAEIAVRGYRRIYLMTADRQPEAEGLYLSSGYTRLAEPRT